MTLEQWIEHVERLRNYYIEGAITAREYFNAVIFYSHGVEIPNEPK